MLKEAGTWDVIANPAKKSSGDPSFLVREKTGWPVALVFNQEMAESIVKALDLLAKEVR
jgi:hypothetical protein